MANAAVDQRPLSVRGLDHLLLLVDDMESALRFYQDVLGCRIKESLPQYGMAELAAGAGGVDLVDISAAAGAWAGPRATDGRNLDHFCLAVEVSDENALRAHLAAHGAPIVEERAEGDHLSLYTEDPSGNRVELRFRRPG